MSPWTAAIVKPTTTSGIAACQHRHENADLTDVLVLLRARRERPRCRASEQRDELAPFHSITSSVRNRSDSGIVTPSALAVVRLMTRSNFVGCSTGMSDGLVPRKILST